MAKKHSRRLVIDADVVGSATTSDHPVSSACRHFLETVLDVGHHVVITTTLLQEWRRHRSWYSVRWLTQMYGKQHVHRHDAEHDENLRRRIASAVPEDRDRKAAEKDVHLIETALGTDRLVASRDEQARGLFREASRGVRELKPIVWVNPTLPADDPIGWLRNGAPSEAHRQLGA